MFGWQLRSNPFFKPYLVSLLCLGFDLSILSTQGVASHLNIIQFCQKKTLPDESPESQHGSHL